MATRQVLDCDRACDGHVMTMLVSVTRYSHRRRHADQRDSLSIHTAHQSPSFIIIIIIIFTLGSKEPEGLFINNRLK